MVVCGCDGGTGVMVVRVSSSAGEWWWCGSSSAG